MSAWPGPWPVRPLLAFDPVLPGVFVGAAPATANDVRRLRRGSA